jgi:N-acetylmuramoyl-L-alanine amidase
VLTVNDARAAAAILAAASSVRGSLVHSMRMDNTADGLRVTVSIAGQARHSAFPLYSPHRLVFDFEAAPAPLAAVQASSPLSDSAAVNGPAAVREPSAPVPAAPAAATSPAVASPTAIAVMPVPAAGIAAAPASAPAPSAHEPSPAPPSRISGSYSLARQLGLGVSRIVIDPGHGGSDPGASANGVTEAALVLDVALRLEKLLLDQPGFEVVLTRRTNASVPLERRTAVANTESADLFLSIHANSSPRRETAGVETYFLNLATNPQAEAVAARENASSALEMRRLPQLVRAITTNNKLAESRELAGAVQSSLVRRLRPRNRLFQDLGVKQAPFMVLIGAQMPSVLAEIAFLTNRTEAGLLKQNAYKQQIAQALCDAILQYRSSLKKVATVAASAEGR